MDMEKKLHLVSAERPSASPPFTESTPGRAVENAQDEADILGGDNQNESILIRGVQPIEDEPADFMRGEVDVKEQMDRAARALNGSEGSPQGELGSSFKDTPGGLEEVEMKTDQEMAKSKVRRLGRSIEPEKNH